MPFNVILEQLPDNSNPNHFEYQSLVAFNTRLDAEMIKASIDNILNSLRTTHREATYLLFKLENLEDRFDESVIGRVVTTRQLIDILKADEFVEDSADCSLLLGAITVTFIEHYANSLWRIHY